MYFVLYYRTLEDFIEKRVPFRQQHLEYAMASRERQELYMGGAFTESTDGAMLIFHVEDPEIVVEFAKNDPYVINGLVVDWNVRGWNVVIGD